MSDCQVTFWCPPMAIERLPHGLHRTAAEPMRCTVTLLAQRLHARDKTSEALADFNDLPSNNQFTIQPVTIPPTLTRKTGLLEWTVDACVGDSALGAEYCDRCDGCGWYEGGITIQTKCEKCNGTGFKVQNGGNRVRVELPKERCEFKFMHPSGEWRGVDGIEQYSLSWVKKMNWPIALIAEAIDAPTTLWLSDGRTFKGIVTFPECRIADPLFNPTADELTTTGGALTEVKP